jgi:hypothetical protein
MIPLTVMFFLRLAGDCQFQHPSGHQLLVQLRAYFKQMPLKSIFVASFGRPHTPPLNICRPLSHNALTLDGQFANAHADSLHFRVLVMSVYVSYIRRR